MKCRGNFEQNFISDLEKNLFFKNQSNFSYDLKIFFPVKTY